MDGFFVLTVRRVLLRIGFFALAFAAAGGAAQAVSISPSGNVPAQSTLTVTWAPVSSQNVVAVILMQASPNGPIWFNNTAAGGANTGSTHVTLPSGLTCGPTYIYKVFEEELPPGGGALLTWGNAQGSYSPSFTIACPRSHPMPFSVHVDMAAPKIEGRGSCSKGDEVVNGKCVATRDSDKRHLHSDSN